MEPAPQVVHGSREFEIAGFCTGGVDVRGQLEPVQLLLDPSPGVASVIGSEYVFVSSMRLNSTNYGRMAGTGNQARDDGHVASGIGCPQAQVPFRA